MKVCTTVCWRQLWGWSVWERNSWVAKSCWRRNFRGHAQSSATSQRGLRGEECLFQRLTANSDNCYNVCWVSLSLPYFRLHDNCSSTQQTNNVLEQKLHSVVRKQAWLYIWCKTSITINIYVSYYILFPHFPSVSDSKYGRRTTKIELSYFRADTAAW